MVPAKYMTAAVLTGHGGLEKLVVLDDIPVPKPKANEVLINVGACGMNNTDINTRIGWYSKSVDNGTNSKDGSDGSGRFSEEDATWGGAAVVFPLIQGADVVADIVGGADFSMWLNLLRRGGRYVTSGAIAGPIVELDLRTLYLKDLEMHGATVMPAEIFENLVSYIEKGEIRPLLAGEFSINDIKKAQEAFLAKNHTGNFVILPGQNDQLCWESRPPIIVLLRLRNL